MSYSNSICSVVYYGFQGLHIVVQHHFLRMMGNQSCMSIYLLFILLGTMVYEFMNLEISFLFISHKSG